MTSPLLTLDLVNECKKRLLTMKQDLLNRIRTSASGFVVADRAGGDEIDLTVALLEEHSFLINHERLRHQLMEIEFALARIEQGTFGFCEETEEPIEVERLIAIPWTRLSIEGAELREALGRKFART
ncbi:MAG: TraR/DksA family transcriptional regulator [Bdellovibrionota bacterium]